MYMLIWILVFKLCFCYHTLLFSTRKDIRIAHITKSKKIYTLVKDLRETVAVDYLYNSSLICWSEHTIEEIDCITYNGTHTGNRTVFEKLNVPSPDGLACDWLTKNIYWTDSETKRIEVKSLQSKYRKVLFWQDLDQPRGIAVDPLAGFLFWTDWGEIPKIERSSMSGDLTTRKIIISENIFWPNSVSLDITAERLYWCDGKLHVIEVTDYDGRNRKVLAQKGIQYPFALTLNNEKIYWTDWNAFSIYSLDRKGGVNVKEVFHYEDAPTDIEVYDAAHQPYKRTPCEENNGGCSHLCLLSSIPPGYSCACPTGIKHVNSTTCANNVEHSLLLVQRTGISKISLDTPDHTNFELPLKGIKHAIGIDYDPVEEYFYWTDDDLKSIQRAKLDGSKQENVITYDIFNPDGIAVDSIARNIYWSDAGANRIEIFRLNTNFRKTIIVDDLEKPRAVVVSPQHGWLFWSDWDEKNPKIERSDLDGTNRLILVQENIKWPNGIALDLEKNKLYWGDAKIDKIEVVNMNGTDRREVLSENLSHVFGLSLLGDYIYWTDWLRRTIEKVNKYNNQDKHLILDQLQDVMGIKAIGPTKIIKNPCAINNGGCEQFCLMKPDNKYICSCQIEYELGMDNRSCIIPDAFIIMHSNTHVRRVGIQNSASQDIIPVTGIKLISAIDVDIVDKRLYWADNRIKTINRAFLNGSQMEKIVEFGLHSPESLAIDWLSSNLYWADAGNKRIEVTKLNGQFRRTLFWLNLKEPRNLVLDPRVGIMFWSEWDKNGAIVRADMDGASKIYILTNIGRVNSLTIDYSQRFLYWTENIDDVTSIEICDSKGRNKRQIARFSSQFKPFSIAQHENLIYWSNWFDGSVMQANKHTGDNQTKIFSQSEKISDLRIIHSSKQMGWNNCAHNNGDCKYLCLITPGMSDHTTKQICACPSHHTTDKNGICVPPDSFLLFSQRNALYRLIEKKDECPDVPLPVPNLKSVRAIEYDPMTKFVYWIDGKVQAIKRSYENGSHSMIIVSGGNDEQYYHFYDIALEPLNKLLFWSCSATDMINITRLNNSSLGVIFKSVSGEKPRSLAIHSEKGLLFWTDVGSKPKIVRSRLDGQRQMYIETDGQAVETLTIDSEQDMIFYGFRGKLFTCDFNGNNKMLLLSTNNKKIIVLAVLNAFLYWFDKDSQRIERMNKTSGEDKKTIVDQVQQITDLLAVQSANYHSYITHPCSQAHYHGNCSHICMLSLESREKIECSCPIGLKLNEDGRTCSSLSGGVCISSASVCDGKNHCEDTSDESRMACNRHLVKSDSYVEDNSNTVVLFALLLIILFVIMSAFIVFRCKNRVKRTNTNDQDIAALKPLAPGFGLQIGTLTTAGSKSISIPHSTMNGGGSTGSYDRSHIITGASSSTSMNNYPLNPPPSPSTTLLQEECCCFQYTPPPPTPCSTDVCDESDTNYKSVSIPNSTMNGGGSMGSYDRSHITCASSSTSMSNCPLNPPPSPATIISGHKCSYQCSL